ncbi:hypothetical protein THAOC_24400, partial [Thalassiosira oceanica]
GDADEGGRTGGSRRIDGEESSREERAGERRRPSNCVPGDETWRGLSAAVGRGHPIMTGTKRKHGEDADVAPDEEGTSSSNPPDWLRCGRPQKMS